MPTLKSMRFFYKTIGGKERVFPKFVLNFIRFSKLYMCVGKYIILVLKRFIHLLSSI